MTTDETAFRRRAFDLDACNHCGEPLAQHVLTYDRGGMAVACHRDARAPERVIVCSSGETLELPSEQLHHRVAITIEQPPEGVCPWGHTTLRVATGKKRPVLWCETCRTEYRAR